MHCTVTSIFSCKISTENAQRKKQRHCLIWWPLVNAFPNPFLQKMHIRWTNTNNHLSKRNTIFIYLILLIIFLIASIYWVPENVFIRNSIEIITFLSCLFLAFCARLSLPKADQVLYVYMEEEQIVREEWNLRADCDVCTAIPYQKCVYFKCILSILK